MKRKKAEIRDTEKIWIKKTIDVLLPIDGYGSYQDVFTFLAKVVDSVDPKYKYIIGLLNTCYIRNGSISNSQTKMASDIISYFRQNGYFKESENESK